jgi:disulfide bond formation protein DsbB
MRKTIFLLMAVMVLALMLVACGGGSDEADSTDTGSESTGDAVAGETLFQGKCASCHGVDAKGLPNLGKDMTISAFIKSLSDNELLAFVKTGRPVSDSENTTGVDMPPRGGNPDLDDEELLDIIAFIRTVVE